ncbi:MAG: acyl-CoA/acyl-ACP dehydrogenase [bacterium]|nr:acyl-CoA/acyl-ACP dehydrogenase [bacterium]
MDFDITEEQELLQETIAQFVANECPPTRLREIFDGETGYDPALWTGLIELGLGGITVPEEFGGAGLELLDLALACETLGAGAVPGPFLGHSLAGLALQLAGSDEQKKTWLPRLATGEVIGSVAFAEGGTAWQPEEWQLGGDDKLSGRKLHVPNASLADVIIVGTVGGGLALIERAAAGVEIKQIAGVDRTRRLEELNLDGVEAQILPQGSGVAGRLRDAGLLLLSADAFGGANRLVEMSVEHARTREQFGVTIGHFQALKHQLANMATEVEPCRGLFWYAAHAFDHVQAESERSAALAKSHITDVYMQVARDSVEAHGGIGFTWECDVQIYFKRAMFDRAFLGMPAVHRERAAVLAGW